MNRAVTTVLPQRQALWRLATNAVGYAHAHRGALRAVFTDLIAVTRLARAWATGRYTAVPWRTIALLSGALVYFLNPLDVVPDMIPLTGNLDDVMVIGLVVSAIRVDIERFTAWETEREADGDDLPARQPLTG